jgi:hypothetical protein
MNKACMLPFEVINYFFQSIFFSSDCSDVLALNAMVPKINFILYLFIFLLTCFLESFFYLSLIKNICLKKKLLALLICNLATHPFVSFGIPWIFSKMSKTYGESLMIGELFAFIVELVMLQVFWQQNWLNSFVISFLANLFSWSLGTYLFLWILF